MQPFETWLKADLQAPVTVKRIDGNLFSGDNQGNLVGVTVTDAGEPATLSGEVRGYFIRSDGNTVIMSGTIDGNKVTVVLPSACYTVVGQFSLVIKVGQVAVGACTGYVYQSNTDSTVDPEHVIPDIDQLLTRVEALEGRATTLEGDVSAQNNTINAIEDGLAIIATGNVHPAIANGQFVYVKGHSSLAEGLYRATAAIGTNATLSTSNLTADGSGGLNALKGEVDSLNGSMSSNQKNLALQDWEGKAPRSMYTGDFIYWNNVLYRAKQNISGGTVLTSSMLESVQMTNASSLPGALNVINGNQFLGEGQRHFTISADSYSNNIDTICNHLFTDEFPTGAGGFFSIDIQGLLTNPATGSNRSFAYGWLNGDNTYCWIEIKSFVRNFKGKRNNSSTFTFTEV